MFTGDGYNKSQGSFHQQRALRSFKRDTVGDTLLSTVACMCVRYVCIRVSECPKAALLLAAVLANWQQIKSRAGAVYVTWEKASDAFQQLACLSLRGDSVHLSDSCSLSVRHLSVCGSCLVFLYSIYKSVTLYRGV